MIRRWWRYWRSLQLMGRHERWRVAMGCPGVSEVTGYVDASGRTTITTDRLTPRRGEVYCRCERCHDARALVGWEPLP